MAESPLQITSAASPEGTEIKIEGALGLKNAEAALQKLTSLIKGNASLVLDLSKVDYLDGQGVAVLIELRARCAAAQAGFSIKAQSEVTEKMLGLISADKILAPLPPARKKESFLEQLGGATIDLYEDMKEIVRFVGECSIMIWQALWHPSKIRWRSVWTNLEKTGVDALPIVCMIQFMIGVILSVLGKSVLGMYGATAFIPDLVAIALAQELGPLITAVVLAGRSGASYAAEIGTMQVSEEIDALRSMGFEPGHFLVLPKIIAAGIAMPCLLIIGNVVAIIGSIIMCELTTDITLPAYLREVYRAVNISMFTEGLVKAFFFAILIAGVSCMRGMQVRGGAESVGRYTTAAVVSGIFITILTDSLFTILFHPPF
jgi:phospholipid/cholesterol/gamma-HCH transport system permease protein